MCQRMVQMLKLFAFGLGKTARINAGDPAYLRRGTAAQKAPYAAITMPSSALMDAGQIALQAKNGIAALLVLTAPYPALTRTATATVLVAAREATVMTTTQARTKTTCAGFALRSLLITAITERLALNAIKDAA